ncbi:6597_t:CDS:2, partial [Dentiscutata erythropus]
LLAIFKSHPWWASILHAFCQQSKESLLFLALPFPSYSNSSYNKNENEPYFLTYLVNFDGFKAVEVNSNKGLVFRSAVPIKNKTWESIIGKIRIFPKAIFEPSTLEDLIDIVKLATITNKTIRCVAQGHLMSSLSDTENYLVVVTNLNKVTVQKHPKYGWTATAEAGTSLSDFENALRNHDPPLTIDSATEYNTLRVSGVVATGAHGGKTSSGIISDQLCSMKIVTGSGEVSEFSEEISESEFNAAKVNLVSNFIIIRFTWYNLFGDFPCTTDVQFRMNDVFIPINEWLNPKNVKNLLESSEGAMLLYFPFNGFNPSDPNSLDPNRDQIWVKNWVRTDEPVSFTQQQLEQSQENQRQDAIIQYKLRNSLIQNPKATPNITATLWSDFTASSGNTSFVYQVPEVIHFLIGEESIKFEAMESAFKVSPDFSNVVTEYLYITKLLRDFAEKGKFPINYFVEFRFIKSTEALLSNTFNKDPEVLYCHIDLVTAAGTPYWEEFVQLIALRLFDKYKAKPHWTKEWEYIPNVRTYLSEVLLNEIKQFEKIRAKYDPNKMFFDNKSLQDIFSKALN